MLKTEGDYFSHRHFELALMARGAARASLRELAEAWESFTRLQTVEEAPPANKSESELRQ